MKWLTLAISCLLLAGCGDSITDYVNEQFPPVSEEDQRQKAITSTAETLGKITKPNLSFGIDLKSVEKALNSQKLKDLGVFDVTLSGERQLLRADVSFDITVEKTDDGENSDANTLLGSLKPKIKGKIAVYAGITNNILSGEKGEKILNLHLLPALSSIEVESIEITGSFEVPVVGELLTAVLNKYADNISGELSRLPIMNVKLPAVYEDKADLSGPIHLEEADGLSVNATLNSNSVVSPIKLYGIASLVTEAQLIGMAQFIGVDTTGPSGEPAKIKADYDAIREAFYGYINASFDVKDLSATAWVGVRKDLLATIVNDVTRQATLCVSGNAKLERQKLSRKIEFPDESAMDCTPTKDCTPTRDCTYRNMDCRQTEDCSGRHIDCGGKNPISKLKCELGKTAWKGRCEFRKKEAKVSCEARKAGKQLDCKRLEKQEKIQCEIEKKGEKTACEAGKELLKRLARTGNFANLDVASDGVADINVCLSGFQLSKDLSKVDLILTARGQAKVNVSMKFTPLGIVGHLACQLPWTEDQIFNASVLPTNIPISTTIKLSSSDQGASYNFSVAEITIPLSVKPGPTEFMLKSANMTLACQGLNLLKPLLVLLTPFVPELKGDFVYKMKAKQFSVDVPLPSQEIGDISIEGTLQETSTAIIVVGRVK